MDRIIKPHQLFSFDQQHSGLRFESISPCKQIPHTTVSPHSVESSLYIYIYIIIIIYIYIVIRRGDQQRRKCCVIYKYISTYIYIYIYM